MNTKTENLMKYKADKVLDNSHFASCAIMKIKKLITLKEYEIKHYPSLSRQHIDMCGQVKGMKKSLSVIELFLNNEVTK